MSYEATALRGHAKLTRFDQPMHAPSIDLWLARRIVAGWTPQAIVAAADGQLSLRTAYRWRKAIVGLECVVLGDHEAWFALRRNREPIRVSAWTKR